MAIMKRSLGTVIAAGRGIRLSSATSTTGTPHVLTLASLHGIPSLAQNSAQALRRFAVWGNTGGVTVNGIWNLVSTGTDTFRCEGSVANGTAVTVTNAVVAAVFDQTPFMRGHAAVAMATNLADQVAFDGTFTVQGSRQGATDAAILASNATNLATFFEDAVSDVAWSVPGPTNDGTTEFRNINLRRFMYLDCSAYTAGGLEVVLLV